MADLACCYVAIIIACLVSFRAMYNKQPAQKKYSGDTNAYPLKNVYNSSSKKLTENETTIQGGKSSSTTLDRNDTLGGPDVSDGANRIQIVREYGIAP